MRRKVPRFRMADHYDGYCNLRNFHGRLWRTFWVVMGAHGRPWALLRHVRRMTAAVAVTVAAGCHGAQLLIVFRLRRLTNASRTPHPRLVNSIAGAPRRMRCPSSRQSCHKNTLDAFLREPPPEGIGGRPHAQLYTMPSSFSSRPSK